MKRRKKKNVLGLLIPASLTVGAIIWWMIASVHYPGKPLQETAYVKIKAAPHTKGTHFRTLVLRSGDGRTASGTLIQNSEIDMVITAGHYFANTHPSTTYWYMLDDRTNYISRVFSHPRPGPLGPRDIAFCVSGKQRAISGYFATKRDTAYSGVTVLGSSPQQAVLLQGNVPLNIIGTLFRNPENPFCIIKYTTRDGESGSGLISKGKFYVITGNVPMSTEDLAPAFGAPLQELTLITEL